jgi:IS30 family transposase
MSKGTVVRQIEDIAAFLERVERVLRDSAKVEHQQLATIARDLGRHVPDVVRDVKRHWQGQQARGSSGG